MPINVTVTNPGKISTGNHNKILVFTLAASKLFILFYFFTWACHGIYSLLTGHTKNTKLNGFNMKSRL